MAKQHRQSVERRNISQGVVSRATSFEDYHCYLKPEAANSIMRILLILIVLVAAAIGIGWLSVNIDGNSANITVNSEKAKSDTSEILGETRNAAEAFVSGAKNAAEETGK